MRRDISHTQRRPDVKRGKRPENRSAYRNGWPSIERPWYNHAMRPLPINEKLIWDYDIPADAQENEAFRRWYIARVLSRGGDADLRAIGFQTIHDYLPHLVLPREIRDFWEWYFSQPKVRDRYGNLDPLPETHSIGHWA